MRNQPNLFLKFWRGCFDDYCGRCWPPCFKAPSIDQALQKDYMDYLPFGNPRCLQFQGSEKNTFLGLNLRIHNIIFSIVLGSKGLLISIYRGSYEKSYDHVAAIAALYEVVPNRRCIYCIFCLFLYIYIYVNIQYITQKLEVQYHFMMSRNISLYSQIKHHQTIAKLQWSDQRSNWLSLQPLDCSQNLMGYDGGIDYWSTSINKIRVSGTSYCWCCPTTRRGASINQSTNGRQFYVGGQDGYRVYTPIN